MTLNIVADDGQSGATPSESASREFMTVVGLFEDLIDARQALTALTRDGCPRESVSMLMRDLKADEGGPAQRHGAVAKAVEEADLNGHSRWLLGLASIIVPQRGTFLVAGPIGAALASVSLDDDDARDAALTSILNDFGFSDDEGGYIESRLLVGAMFVAITSNSSSTLTSARNVMSNNNAVHIGSAPTLADVADSATDLLVSPPEVYSTSDVVVTDAVAPLHTLINGKLGAEWALSMKGTRVVDLDGAECGRIENLIAEITHDEHAEARLDQVRYVVVSFGGVLGIGRHLAAVPIEHITIEDDPAQVQVAREVLHDAPSYVSGVPFSRREEQVVCAYFGCTPYWTE